MFDLDYVWQKYFQLLNKILVKHINQQFNSINFNVVEHNPKWLSNVPPDLRDRKQKENASE
jgi:hypothetical protein